MAEAPKTLDSFLGPAAAAPSTPAVAEPVAPVAETPAAAPAVAPARPPLPLVAPAPPDNSQFDIEEPEFTGWPGQADPAAAAPTTPAATPPAPAPAPPTYSDAVVARAKAAGFDVAELQDLGDEKAVAAVLDRIDRRDARLFRQQAAAPAAAPVPAPAPAPKPAEPVAFDRKPLLDAGYDPKIVDALEASHNRAVKQDQELTSLRTVLEQQQKADQQRQQRALFAEIDRTFDALPAEFHGITGAKTGADQSWFQSAEFKARAEIVTEAQALQIGYERLGRPVPPIQDLIPRIARSLHAEKLIQGAGEAVRRDLDNRLRDASGKFIARPTPREEAPRSADDRAVEAMRNLLRERTGIASAGGEPVVNDFPDFAGNGKN